MDDTPRSVLYDDVYFSVDDGPAETRHVFLDGNDLPRRWQGAARHTIGETGFGTGLNFLLAWQLFDETAQPDAFLDFVSVEKHPMSVEEIRAGLSPWADRLSPYLEKMLAQYPLRVPGFHRMVFDNRVALTLIFDDANEGLAQITGQVDSWFLDGFTPSKNPGMWTQSVFNEMARLSHAQTTFATFTAAGFVKRGLRDAGFVVEKRPGFGRKRDMLAGHFQSGETWAASQAKTVAIIGAGLAGTSCAYALKQYGLNPVLYDEAGIARGASGNPIGLINPRLSALREPASNFYTSAYAQALRMLHQFDSVDFYRAGALHLITDAEKKKRFEQTAANWQWHTNHMRLVDAVQASEIAGIPLKHDALFLPDSAYVSPRLLCEALARDVPLVKKTITALHEVEADAVILANGVGAAGFIDCPIHSVRGQITEIEGSSASSALKTNLHYGGYLSACKNGRHVVGSTFQRWIAHTDLHHEDNVYNLAMMQAAVPALTGEYRVLSARAAMRCASKDRFPLIGQVTPALYVSTAHGSHGIISSLAGAHLIADAIRGGIGSQSSSAQQALNPGRFTAL